MNLAWICECGKTLFDKEGNERATIERCWAHCAMDSPPQSIKALKATEAPPEVKRKKFREKRGAKRA